MTLAANRWRVVQPAGITPLGAGTTLVVTHNLDTPDEQPHAQLVIRSAISGRSQAIILSAAHCAFLAQALTTITNHIKETTRP